MKYTRTELYDIQQSMTTYGGSFVKKLAELLPLADDINLNKLAETFESYFDKYLEMSKYDKEHRHDNR